MIKINQDNTQNSNDIEENDILSDLKMVRGRFLYVGIRIMYFLFHFLTCYRFSLFSNGYKMQYEVCSSFQKILFIVFSRKITYSWLFYGSH